MLADRCLNLVVSTLHCCTHCCTSIPSYVTHGVRLVAGCTHLLRMTNGIISTVYVGYIVYIKA